MAWWQVALQHLWWQRHWRHAWRHLPWHMSWWYSPRKAWQSAYVSPERRRQQRRSRWSSWGSRSRCWWSWNWSRWCAGRRRKTQCNRVQGSCCSFRRIWWCNINVLQVTLEKTTYLCFFTKFHTHLLLEHSAWVLPLPPRNRHPQLEPRSSQWETCQYSILASRCKCSPLQSSIATTFSSHSGPSILTRSKTPWHPWAVRQLKKNSMF